MRTRPVGVVFVLFGLMALVAGAVSAQSGEEGEEEPVRTDRVESIGTFDFKPNTIVFSTFAFYPGAIEVSQGDSIEFAFGEADLGQEPHTVTIVEEGDLPTTIEEVFACQPCMEAMEAHFEGELPEMGPPAEGMEAPESIPQPVVEAGEEGLDAAGDSLWFGPDESIEATVSASAGTTLQFLCALHPWMQGSITIVE
ncbi:MAG: hypothetical protein WD533_01640 [Dehalococcoidia bacterium]